MTKALLVIDVQNDYFTGGGFPLWNPDGALAATEHAIARARAAGVPVIHIQHIADAARGPSPFFNAGTHGVELHPRVRATAPDAPVVVKTHADAFLGTTLAATLAELAATEIVICGMMTQNCVTHTAISKAAERFAVTIIPDACTTVSEILHHIALHAVAPRVKLAPANEAL
jgi:nicotinamidase-related amidase